ncbi:hypothetical protein Tco_0567767 [Tanacetum coccineum]
MGILLQNAMEVQTSMDSNNLVLVIDTDSNENMIKKTCMVRGGTAGISKRDREVEVFQRSTQQCMKSRVAKHLGVVGIHQQNGLVNKTNVTLFAKVVLYRNMVFNESKEYKKTFIGSGVGTGSVQVLQGVEFEVEPHEDHTFEVEPHGNVDHVAEDNNEAAFAVAAVDKIYAHESLTFNNTIACEVISKWKVRLKDDMDTRSDVYVLNNGCRKCSDDIEGYYWEYTLGVSGGLHEIDIASADVGMLDKFDRGLQTDVQVLWILTTPWVDESQVRVDDTGMCRKLES